MLRRLLTVLFVTLFCLVVGCASDADDECDVVASPTPAETVKVYKLVIHANVPGPKVGPIIDAAAEWSSTLNGAFVFEVKYAEFDTAALSANGEMRVYLGPRDPNSKYIGMTQWWGADANGRPNRSVIWLADSLAERTYYLTALHEIGHAIGLGHSDDPASIMQPTITDIGDHPRCVDEKKACEIWGCTPDC